MHITYLVMLISLTVSSFDYVHAFTRPSAKKRRQKKGISHLIIRSSVFENNGEIPKQYTCDGEDMSPPFSWYHWPVDTKSFALIGEDVDALGDRPWVHWLVFDIPATVQHLIPGVSMESIGAAAGINSWGAMQYGGPCPPLEKHHYRFTLYALDVPQLGIQEGANRDEFHAAIKGHILGRAVLVGRYQRLKRE